MQRIHSFILALFCSFSLSAQVYDASIAWQLHYMDSIREYLQEYEDLGIKSTGTKALDNTRDWLVDYHEALGLSVSLDSFQYNGNEVQNVIIEKKGIDTTRWVILGAHYDSYDNSRGVNDNGTGVVSCMRIARLMKDLTTTAGLRIIYFSAEEDGLKGSQHYVDNSLDPQDNLQLMINLDQLGGSLGQDNSKIICERDEHMTPSGNNAASALVTDTIARLTELYTTLVPEIGKAIASDYMPFQAKGYVITGLYQASAFPFYHTSKDLLIHVDDTVTMEVAKIALAACLHFTGAELSSVNEPLSGSDYELYPNPSSTGLFKISANQPLAIEVFDSRGHMVHRDNYSGAALDLSALNNGVFFLRIRSESGRKISHYKVIIAR